MLPVTHAHHAQQHADRRAGTGTQSRIRSGSRETCQHCRPACRGRCRRPTSAGATRYLPAKKCERRVDQRGQHDRERRAGFARDRGLHGAAQKGFLDQRDDQAGDAAPTSIELEPSPRHPGASPASSSRMSSSSIVPSTRQHEQRAEQEGALPTSRDELPAGRPKPRLCRSATFRRRATNTKPTSRISMPTRLAMRWNFGLSSTVRSAARPDSRGGRCRRAPAQSARGRSRSCACVSQFSLGGRDGTGLWPSLASAASSRPSRPTKCSVPTTTR